jgi:hypothetical protein
VGDGTAAAMSSPHDAIAAVLDAQLNVSEATWPEEPGPLQRAFRRLVPHRRSPVSQAPLRRKEQFEHLIHFGQLIAGLKAARVG